MGKDLASIHSEFCVLLTTSGIGSRLGELTRYTNKGLVMVGGKPALSYIVESYEESIPFVVTLGHFGDHVREYLTLLYPNRIFTFIDVEPFSGTGSSLAFSMLQARDYLQRPFIYHANDSLVFNQTLPPPARNRNWIGGSLGNSAANYASVDVRGNRVSKVSDKGSMQFDYIHTGVVGIGNYESFWEILSDLVLTNPQNESLSDIHAEELLVMAGVDFELVKISEWYDIGNSDALQRVLEIFPNSKVVLAKPSEFVGFTQDKVIKFFASKEICHQRVQRAKLLDNLVPRVISSGDHFFIYNYVEGYNLSNSNDPSRILSFLSWAKNYLWGAGLGDFDEDITKLCNQFYVDKTCERLELFQQTRGIRNSTIVINGKYIKSVEELLEMAFTVVLEDLRPSKFHGDLILDNILLKDSVFTLIDWRQDFAGSLELGDLYYDLAKLNHSFYVNHDLVNRNLFKFQEKNGRVVVEILIKDSLITMRDLFVKWIKNNKLNQKKIEVLTGLIWLNMAPLHHHPFDLFLYHYGLLKLQLELREDNNL